MKLVRNDRLLLFLGGTFGTVDERQIRGIYSMAEQSKAVTFVPQPAQPSDLTVAQLLVKLLEHQAKQTAALSNIAYDLRRHTEMNLQLHGRK